KPRPVDAAGERVAAGERPAFEAAEAKQRVLRPTDRLAELAVADDVDADAGLLALDLGDGLLQALGIGGAVERLPGLLGAQARAQRRRADEAADMGGEDPIGAVFHLAPSPASRRSLLQPTDDSVALDRPKRQRGPEGPRCIAVTPRSGLGRPPRKSIRSSVGAAPAP